MNPLKNGKRAKSRYNSSKRQTKEQKAYTDATGKNDPFFYIRSADSNFEDIAMTKLLINKVIQAWKHILRDKLEVANYITTPLLWVGVKAQLNPILYESIGRNFLMYHFLQRLFDHTFDPASTKSLWDTAIESYDEMYPDWPPVNDGMIPRHIWRYINDNTSSSQHATTTEMPSRGVEDQEDSESNKNKPPPPVSPRKKKSSKRRKKETKRKHGGGDPDGSETSDTIDMFNSRFMKRLAIYHTTLSTANNIKYINKIGTNELVQLTLPG
jgi:hypothetical protein